MVIGPCAGILLAADADMNGYSFWCPVSLDHDGTIHVVSMDSTGSRY